MQLKIYQRDLKFSRLKLKLFSLQIYLRKTYQAKKTQPVYNPT